MSKINIQAPISTSEGDFKVYRYMEEDLKFQQKDRPFGIFDIPDVATPSLSHSFSITACKLVGFDILFFSAMEEFRWGFINAIVKGLMKSKRVVAPDETLKMTISNESKMSYELVNPAVDARFMPKIEDIQQLPSWRYGNFFHTRSNSPRPFVQRIVLLSDEDGKFHDDPLTDHGFIWADEVLKRHIEAEMAKRAS